jgi:hypothetical protein
MRRRLLNLLTALSLLLCLAVMTAWVRSGSRVLSANSFQPWSDGTAWVDRDTTLAISRGALYLQRARHDRWRVGGVPPPEHPPAGPSAWSYWDRRQPDQQFESRVWDSQFAGFGIREERYRASRWGWSPPQIRASLLTTVRIPLWSVVVVACMPLMVRAVRVTRRALVRRRRHAAGLCPSCAYDLRATPGRCPECGAVGNVGDKKGT